MDADHIDDEFKQATDYVASIAGNNQQIPQDHLLKFYGLYKQATEGPCTTSKPSLLNPKARTKWTAWNELGDLTMKEAASAYIDLLSHVQPDWRRGKSARSRKGGIGGPVMSTLALDDEKQDQDINNPLLEAVCHNDIEAVKGLLSTCSPDERRVLVNRSDKEGISALHFAADHGCYDILQLLIDSGADLNGVDCDHQTALHYAAIAERRTVVEALLAAGVDQSIRDSDGCTARDYFSW